MYEDNKTRYFRSIKELSFGLNKGHEYDLLYKGQEYFFSGCRAGLSGKKFTFATAHNEKSLYDSDCLDEVLDNYKIDDKPLREIILDFEVEAYC